MFRLTKVSNVGDCLPADYAMAAATGDEPDLLRVRQLSTGGCRGFFRFGNSGTWRRPQSRNAFMCLPSHRWTIELITSKGIDGGCHGDDSAKALEVEFPG